MPQATVEDPDSDRSVTISRAEFEGHCVELLERCMEPVFNVLEDAQVEATQVDQVVLVGGATRMPRIEQELGKLFGSEVSLRASVAPLLLSHMPISWLVGCSPLTTMFTLMKR